MPPITAPWTFTRRCDHDLAHTCSSSEIPRRPPAPISPARGSRAARSGAARVRGRGAAAGRDDAERAALAQEMRRKELDREEKSIMALSVCEAFADSAHSVIGLGVREINKLPGCWEHQLTSNGG